MSDRLKKETIKLAYNKPELREYLVPLLHKCAKSDLEVDQGQMQKLLGVPEKEKIEDHYSAAKAVKKLVDKVGKNEAARLINWVANISHDQFFNDMQKAVKKP